MGYGELELEILLDVVVMLNNMHIMRTNNWCECVCQVLRFHHCYMTLVYPLPQKKWSRYVVVVAITGSSYYNL